MTQARSAPARQRLHGRVERVPERWAGGAGAGALCAVAACGSAFAEGDAGISILKTTYAGKSPKSSFIYVKGVSFLSNIAGRRR